MTNISKAQTQITRDRIRRLLDNGMSHEQIIDQLQISRSAFYSHLKTMRDIETKIWSQVEIDSSRYRALTLLKSFEDTVRICSQIANSGSTSNKDRIEARKAVDMANAHIFRLVSEGTMFNHMPELSKYIKIAEAQKPELTEQHDINDDIDIDNNNLNNNNNNNNNLNNLSSSLDSSDDSDE